MFCEKCGNQLNEIDKFCAKCGNPVSAPSQPQPASVDNQVPAQQQNTPVENQASVQPQTAFDQNQASGQPQNAFANQGPVQPQYNPVQPQIPAQNFTPKKGLSKGAKLAIIFSSIGVVGLIVILVLVFAVILPMFKTTIDPSKAVSVTFDSYSDDMVYDGSISGEIELEPSLLEEEYPEIFKKNPSASSILDDIFYDATVTYTLSGSGESDYGYKYVYFSDAGKDDILTVTIEWPKSEYALFEIREYENKLGAEIDKSTKTIEFKISDLVSEQELTVKETTELNILDYIKENNIIMVRPSSYDDELYASLKPFTAEIGGYTVVNDSYYNTGLSVYDGDDYITTVYMEFDNEFDFKEGDTITLSYYDYNSDAEANGFVLTGEDVTYTVVAPEMLSLDSAKKNTEAIKNFFLENASDYEGYIEDGDQLVINEIYYITDKEDSDYSKIIIFLNNKTQNYYNYVELSSNGFFSGDEFIFDGYSYYNGKSKTLDEAKDSCYYIDAKSKIYKATKIG